METLQEVPAPTAPPPSQPAGWYPDPDHPAASRRYWDGTTWTENRAPIESQAAGPRNGLAVTSFGLGVVGATIGLVIAVVAFPLPLMLGIAAVPLGFLGYRRAKRDPSAGRKGLATWGIVLGCLSITWGIVGAVAFNNAVGDLDKALNDLGKGTAATAPAPDRPAQPPASNPSPKAQGPEKFQLGEPSVITNGSGRRLGTYEVEAADVTTQVGHGYMAENPSHGYFVEVTLKAHASAHGFSVNPYDWVLIDPRTGHRYDPGDGNSMFGPSSFNAATLYPGETYSGKTTFDVPVQHGELALLGGSWGDKVIGIWKFGGAASASQATQPTASTGDVNLSPYSPSDPGYDYTAALPSGGGWSAPVESHPTAGNLLRTSSTGPDGTLLIIDRTPDEVPTLGGSYDSVKTVSQPAFGSATEYLFSTSQSIPECNGSPCVDFLIDDGSGGGWGVLAGGPSLAAAKSIGARVARSVRDGGGGHRSGATDPSATTATSSGASSCTPGYSPCISPGPDVDCAGGSGDGPRYVQGPVQVSGSDPYALDYDGDGIACE